MDRDQWLAKHFDADRARLRQVAYRFLGSLTEADDAVQEAWLRLSRSEARSIDNLSGWLTTVVARVCLDMLRARKSREEALAALSDRRAGVAEIADLEQEELLAGSVGLALVVMRTGTRGGTGGTCAARADHGHPGRKSGLSKLSPSLLASYRSTLPLLRIEDPEGCFGSC
jgi:Sigma-70 region 2